MVKTMIKNTSLCETNPITNPNPICTDANIWKYIRNLLGQIPMKCKEPNADSIQDVAWNEHFHWSK